VSNRLLISESERNRILSLYQLSEQTTTEGTVTFKVTRDDNGEIIPASASLAVKGIDNDNKYTINISDSGTLKKELPFGSYSVTPSEANSLFTFDEKTFELNTSNPNITLDILLKGLVKDTPDTKVVVIKTTKVFIKVSNENGELVDGSNVEFYKTFDTKSENLIKKFVYSTSKADSDGFMSFDFTKTDDIFFSANTKINKGVSFVVKKKGYYPIPNDKTETGRKDIAILGNENKINLVISPIKKDELEDIKITLFDKDSKGLTIYGKSAYSLDNLDFTQEEADESAKRDALNQYINKLPKFIKKKIGNVDGLIPEGGKKIVEKSQDGKYYVVYEYKKRELRKFLRKYVAGLDIEDDIEEFEGGDIDFIQENYYVALNKSSGTKRLFVFLKEDGGVLSEFIQNEIESNKDLLESQNFNFVNLLIKNSSDDVDTENRDIFRKKFGFRKYPAVYVIEKTGQQDRNDPSKPEGRIYRQFLPNNQEEAQKVIDFLSNKE